MASQTKELLRQKLIRDQRTPSPRPRTPSLRPSTSSRLGRVGGGELDMSRAGPTAGPGSSSPSKNVVDRGVLMRKLLLNPVPAAERWYVLAVYCRSRVCVVSCSGDGEFRPPARAFTVPVPPDCLLWH